MKDAVDNRIALATGSLPPDLRPSVGQWFERLHEQHGYSSLAGVPLGALVRIVACSEFGAAVILQNWQWFVASVASFNERSPIGADFADFGGGEPVDGDTLKAALRRYRNRILLRILWREVIGLSDLDETLEQLSSLADFVLDVATRHAQRSLQTRFGHVRDTSGQAVPLIILGMGKLGGGELNFSSDIDLIFLFTEEGETDGVKSISAQEYFGRVTRLIVALIDEVTPSCCA